MAEWEGLREGDKFSSLASWCTPETLVKLKLDTLYFSVNPPAGSVDLHIRKILLLFSVAEGLSLGAKP